MSATIRILSTKELQQNQKKYLLNAGFSVVEADFITTKSLPLSSTLNINQALIFTSQNAVHAVLKFEKLTDLKTKQVFCVGVKTKNLLEENGFQVEAYAGYAEDLAEIISLVYAHQTYTFFSGNLRRDVLPEKLKEAGISFNEVEVYQTLLTPQKISAKLDGILFFSPSGVESYLKENTITQEYAFCIGHTTAETANRLGIKNIITANQPSVENVIIQCINYFSHKQ